MDVKKKKKKSGNTRQAAVGRRRKRRLRKYTLYYLAFIVFAVAAGVALSLTVFFKIDHITVRGNSKYADGDIVATSGIEEGQNLFMVDTAEARAAIEAAYPYIEHARVRRSFPSGITIEVDLATPDAALRYQNGYMLITAAGRVLEVALTELPGGYTQVIGLEPGDVVSGEYLPESCSEQLVMLSYLEQAFGEVPIEDLDLIDLSDRLDIKLLYQNRLIIHLGSESDLAYKLQFAGKVITEEVGSNFMGVLGAAEVPVSLRYRDIFAAEVWPFGDELLAYYTDRPTVVEADQDKEDASDPDVDAEQQADGQAAGLAEEVSQEASGGATGIDDLPPDIVTINGEPAERYQGGV